MTKAEIVNTIVLETGINKKDVMAIVESLMEEIKNSLEKAVVFTPNGCDIILLVICSSSSLSVTRLIKNIDKRSTAT